MKRKVLRRKAMAMRIYRVPDSASIVLPSGKVIPKRIKFNGIIYHWNKLYYEPPGGPSRGERLHRAVWIAHFGPIQKGYVIHHLDNDGSNNLISNLDCITKFEHQSLHGKVFTTRRARALEQNRKLARSWHGTKEGREWHSNHAKEVWKTRKTTTKQCEMCKRDYECYNPTNSKFCHARCRMASHTQNKTGKTMLVPAYE